MKEGIFMFVVEQERTYGFEGVWGRRTQEGIKGETQKSAEERKGQEPPQLYVRDGSAAFREPFRHTSFAYN